MTCRSRMSRRVACNSRLRVSSAVVTPLAYQNVAPTGRFAPLALGDEPRSRLRPETLIRCSSGVIFGCPRSADVRDHPDGQGNGTHH